MDEPSTHDIAEWDRLVGADTAGQLAEKDALQLRTDEALPHWRTALVRYQRRIEAEQREHHSVPQDGARNRRQPKEILQEVQARFAELRTREKDMRLRQQRAIKEAAKRRRRDKALQNQARAHGERTARSSPEGQRLYQSIHRRALRLTRWAARMVEEMELDAEDPEWSHWLDDVNGLNDLHLKFEAMAQDGEDL
jgi:hypothetical protein